MVGAGTVIEHRLARLGSARVTRAHVALGSARRFTQALTQMAGRVAQALSKDLGKPVSIQARLLPSASRGPEALADPAAFALFELGAVGSAVLLEVETPIAGAFVDALAGGPAAASAPYGMSAAERAALGFLCLLVVRAVREDAGMEKLLAPRFVRAPETTHEAASLVSGLGAHLVVELKVRIGDVQGLARMLVPADPIAALCKAQPAESRKALAVRAEIPAAVRTSPLTLEQSDLDALGAGDVVLVPGTKLCAGRYEGDASIRSAAFELRGAFGPKGFTVKNVLTAASLEEAMPANNVPPPGPNAPRPAPMNGVPRPAQPPASPPRPAAAPQPPAGVPAPKPPPPLPIEIDVEIARIRLSLADLANVEPGAILPLHVTTTDTVVLRIGDKVIARAELVDVEGELGARILAVEP